MVLEGEHIPRLMYLSCLSSPSQQRTRLGHSVAVQDPVAHGAVIDKSQPIRLADIWAFLIEWGGGKVNLQTGHTENISPRQLLLHSLYLAVFRSPLDVVRVVSP